MASANSDEYIGYQLLGVGAAFIVIQTLFILLRVWARHLQDAKAKLDWDDYLIFPAVLCSLLVDGLICAIVINGKVGYHITYLEATQPEVIPTYTKILFATEGIYLAAELLSKLSILFLYLRFFREPIYRRATFSLIALIIATYIGETVAWALQCNPPSDFWQKTPEDGHCFNRQLFYGFLNVPNIITDIAALLLAALMVRKLNLSGPQKLGLLLTFMTGLIGTAASLARCITFFTVSPFTDATWNSVILLIWTVVEPATYVIVACLPSLRILVRSRKDSAGAGISGETVGSALSTFRKQKLPVHESHSTSLGPRWLRGSESRDFLRLDAEAYTVASEGEGSVTRFGRTWRENGGNTVTNDVQVEEGRPSVE